VDEEAIDRIVRKAVKEAVADMTIRDDKYYKCDNEGCGWFGKGTEVGVNREHPVGDKYYIDYPVCRECGEDYLEEISAEEYEELGG
jgi:hypothetical protein